MTSTPVNPAEPADPTDPDVALVLAAYAAYARGDIDAAVAGLHPDVEWVEPEEFPNGGVHSGRDAVHKYLSASYAMWSELHSEPAAYRRGADVVIVHHVHGTLTDDSPLDLTAADVFTLRDGRVVTMHAYADPAEVL
ncbi:nuclear transport factor 2 family protein [Kitasatospora sp. NPDC058162]|uniref:nuclear transport factor 2 family protein n=1 Tax=Kitasatospora sp. NPDC058162 TaxID=3346362 RepID=UPI0036D75C08